MTKTLAIIGTAGRKDDYSKLTAHHYQQMILAAKKVIELEKVTHLVSGGAAWSDNIVLEFGWPTKIYLPADKKCLDTAEYYHKRFFAKVPQAARLNTLLSDNLEGLLEVFNHGNFLDRNLLVAKDADIFLAMTFGDKNEIKDGGTKHTVNAMLKQGKRGYHLSLIDLKLYKKCKIITCQF